MTCYRLNNIKLPLEAGAEEVWAQTVQRVGSSALRNFRVAKKSLDARRKDNLFWVYAAEFEYDGALETGGDLLELVRTGSCQSASINFSLPDLRQELKHAQVITVEIGANDVLVPIMYGISSAMGGPQVFEALLPMLEGDFRQMDASSFAALRENLDSLNITAQQRKALLKLLDSGIAEICTQSQASTLANLEALLQELKALNPDAQIVLVGYYNPVPLLPAPANPFVKHFRTLNRSVQKLAQQYDVAFASAAYTLVANDAHPTACGHKYLARQILKALEK